MNPPEAVPGHYYLFKFLIELTHSGVTHLGYPRQAARVGDTVRWVLPIEYAAPDPSIARAPWIDDPENGLAQRKLTRAEDMLGAQGMFGDKVFTFEKILDTTMNSVTFSLLNTREGWRIAYSFFNELFEADGARQ